jgi:hypothetical protein
MARPADFFVSYTDAGQAWAEWIPGTWRPRAMK